MVSSHLAMLASGLGLLQLVSGSPLEITKSRLLNKRDCYTNGNDGCWSNANPFSNPPSGQCLGVLTVVGAPGDMTTGGTNAAVSFNAYDSNGDNLACVSEVPGGSSYTLCSNTWEYTLEVNDACGGQEASECDTCSMAYGAWSGDCISSSGAQSQDYGVTVDTAGYAYSLAFDC